MAILLNYAENMTTNQLNKVIDSLYASGTNAFKIFYHLAKKQWRAKIFISKIAREIKESEDEVSRHFVRSAFEELEEKDFLYKMTHKIQELNKVTVVFILFKTPTKLSKCQKANLIKYLDNAILYDDIQEKRRTRGKKLYDGRTKPPAPYILLNTSTSIYDFINKNSFKINTLPERLQESFTQNFLLRESLLRRLPEFLELTEREQKEISKLFLYYFENIKIHRNTSEAYKVGLNNLVRKYLHLNKQKTLEIKNRKRGSFAFREIALAFEVYNKLLTSEETCLKRFYPWLVGLNEFFAFSDYNLQTIFGENKKKKPYMHLLENVSSWYSQCIKGKKYCFEKFSFAEIDKREGADVKDDDPELTRIFEECLDGRVKIFPHDKRKLIKISRAWEKFFLDPYNKERFYLMAPVEEKILRCFGRYLRLYIMDNYDNNGKEFKLWYFLEKNFWNHRFKNYLIEQGWYKDLR